jgi:hypothetical protein
MCIYSDYQTLKLWWKGVAQNMEYYPIWLSYVHRTTAPMDGCYADINTLNICYSKPGYQAMDGIRPMRPCWFIYGLFARNKEATWNPSVISYGSTRERLMRSVPDSRYSGRQRGTFTKVGIMLVGSNCDIDWNDWLADSVRLADVQVVLEAARVGRKTTLMRERGVW